MSISPFDRKDYRRVKKEEQEETRILSAFLLSFKSNAAILLPLEIFLRMKLLPKIVGESIDYHSKSGGLWGLIGGNEDSFQGNHGLFNKVLS
jgi:hypothetical protein